MGKCNSEEYVEEAPQFKPRRQLSFAILSVGQSNISMKVGGPDNKPIKNECKEAEMFSLLPGPPHFLHHRLMKYTGFCVCMCNNSSPFTSSLGSCLLSARHMIECQEHRNDISISSKSPVQKPGALDANILMPWNECTMWVCRKWSECAMVKCATNKD